MDNLNFIFFFLGLFCCNCSLCGSLSGIVAVSIMQLMFLWNNNFPFPVKPSVTVYPLSLVPCTGTWFRVNSPPRRFGSNSLNECRPTCTQKTCSEPDLSQDLARTLMIRLLCDRLGLPGTSWRTRCIQPATVPNWLSCPTSITRLDGFQLWFDPGSVGRSPG